MARRTTEEFVALAKERWGDRWDYSKVEYKRGQVPITIICPAHGEYQTRPANHLRGSGGCPVCSDGRRLSSQDFFSRAKDVWGDRWDYSNSTYVSTLTPMTIQCPAHGEFKQLPKFHLRGAVGCPKCNVRTQENFLERATKVWSDRWGYENTVFDGANSKVTISCPDHGDFDQLADKHLRGHIGCRSCAVGTSGGELQLGEFLDSLGLNILRGDRSLLEGQELDFYFPESNVGIEFNGIYYHSEKFKGKNYHLDKFLAAQRAGIRLIQIWEDDWRDRPDIVKEHIRRVLNVSTQLKVNARDTTIAEISSFEASEFLEKNHIQGFTAASVYCAALLQGSVVAVAAFKKQGNDFVLVRYATSAMVRGGHSKIVSYFERAYKYGKLITFGDLSFGDGHLYRSTGWIEDKQLPPDYSYVKSGKRHHKFGFRLSKFKNDPALLWVEGATERQLAQLNGLTRIYDAGKIRFTREHK